MSLLLALGSGCSREAKRDRYLKRAHQYCEAQAYQKAAIEYINALRLHPEHPEAVRGLGRAYFEQGQINRAFAALIQARKLDPNDVESRSRLCRIYFDARDLPKARELAAEILVRDPAHTEALLVLAETASTPEETAEVEQRLQTLRGQGGERPVFHLLAGLASLRQKDFEKAEAAFRRAAALDPKSPFPLRVLGNLHLARGEMDAARKAFEQEVALAPNDRFARLRLAEFKVRTGSAAEGKAILEGMTRDAPDFVPAWTYLAGLAFDERRYEDCAPLVARVLAQRPEDFRALLLKAKLSLAKTNLAQAVEELKRLRTYYEKVPQVHFELARAYLATNEVANALGALDQAVALNPNYAEALFLKGQVNMRRGDAAAAVATFGELARQNPRMVPAQIALAEAHRARGSLDEALGIYRTLAATYPTNPEPAFLMGMVYRQQKKHADARHAFERALELSPGNLAALNQILDLHLEQKDFSGARQLVEGVLAKTPDSAPAWFMLAKVHLAQGQTTNAENALLKTIQFDTNSLAAYSILARLYVASNRSTEAVRKLDEALIKAPSNIPTLTLKAMILNAVSNYTAAAESYEKILAVAPRFGLALNNLAYLYSESLPKLDRAYELATKAREMAPDSPQVADTLGWILYRRGDYARALTLLADAAAKLPDEAEVIFHLGMVHYMQGQEKEARTSLQRALELNKDFPGADEAKQRLTMLAGDTGAADPQAAVRLEKLLEMQPNDPVGWTRLADLQARGGAFDKARSSYERVLKLNPRSVPALIGLARLYAEKLSAPAKALELAKQARTLAPGDPQVGHSAGRAAFLAGDHAWAFGVLDEAVKQLPGQPEVRYDHAWAAYSLGRVPEAQDSMRQVLKVVPPFPRADQARQFLALTESSTNVAAAQAALKSDPEYVPALMVLSAAQVEQGNLKDARQTYEKVLARYPGFGPAMKALVSLPGGSGDDRRDYDLATQARRAFPTDPQVAKALGRAMFKRGDSSAAVRLLQEAVKALPEDAEAHFYLGAAQFKLGNKAQGQRDLQRASELGLQGPLALEATRLLLETK